MPWSTCSADQAADAPASSYHHPSCHRRHCRRLPPHRSHSHSHRCSCLWMAVDATSQGLGPHCAGDPRTAPPPFAAPCPRMPAPGAWGEMERRGEHMHARAGHQMQSAYLHMEHRHGRRLARPWRRGRAGSWRRLRRRRRRRWRLSRRCSRATRWRRGSRQCRRTCCLGRLLLLRSIWPPRSSEILRGI